MFTFRPWEVASHWLGFDSRMWENWELGSVTTAIASISQNQSFVMLKFIALVCHMETNLYTLIISLVVHFPSAYFPNLWLKERETYLLAQLGRNKKITRPAGSTTPLSIQSWHRLQAGSISEKVGLATFGDRVQKDKDEARRRALASLCHFFHRDLIQEILPFNCPLHCLMNLH